MNARHGTSELRGQSTPHDARFLVDEQGAVAEWSTEAQQLLGYPADEVLGRPVKALLSDRAGSASAGFGRHPPRRGETLSARHRDGHHLDVRAQVRLLVKDAVHWAVILKAADSPEEQELDTALLRALLTASPLGVQVLDPDLRVRRLNLFAPGARGVVGEEAIGRLAREVAPGVVDDVAEQTIRKVLDTGDPVVDFEHVGRPPSDPDHDHVYSVTLLPLKDENGSVLGVCVTSQDVSGQHRAQARLHLLVEAGTRIGTTLDVRTTAEELTVVSVPALADIVTVDVLDDVLHGEASPPGPVNAETLVRRAAFHAAEGLDTRPAYAPDELVPTHPPFADCLADLQPRLLHGVNADRTVYTLEPHRAELIRKAGVHSMMVVPLTARGVVLGIAAFYRARTADPFKEDDLALAAELAARAAVCIDNARQFTREHSAALILQRNLLPQHVPAQNAVEVAWHHEPAHDVGDWFDVIPLSGARVALMVGHLVGQTMQAAAEMGWLRSAVNALATQDLAPEELLAKLNDLVTGQTNAHSPEGTSARTHLIGATCVYAVYDPITRRCTFARAGGLAPVIVTPEGTVHLPDVPFGPPLAMGRPPYEAVDVELPTGSAIVLSTSSLVQSGDPQSVPAGLRQILTNPHRPLEDTCDAVVRAHRDSGVDSIVLLARTKDLGEDQVASWSLPNDPAVVATARTLAGQQLANWGLEEMEPVTELIVSELVTNAIRYTTGPIHLRLIRDLTLICEVADNSSTAPHLRLAYETDEGGRGLFLIAQLTRRWGTRFTARGKSIWAEQALP
ncbi:SpoIIE family protein phosphatase [Streptomyces mirabilis]|uniref:SpoIIE family protein phosphatase n=1 Tax=Streptomyces mirabilis TaxID=68239 RepID=UPI00371BAE82